MSQRPSGRDREQHGKRSTPPPATAAATDRSAPCTAEGDSPISIAQYCSAEPEAGRPPPAAGTDPKKDLGQRWFRHRWAESGNIMARHR